MSYAGYGPHWRCDNCGRVMPQMVKGVHQKTCHAPVEKEDPAGFEKVDWEKFNELYQAWLKTPWGLWAVYIAEILSRPR